jgi:EpsI family protein
MSSYVMRAYAADAQAEARFSLYVGYYDSQTQGKTIHSPKNCLPGAGWEALASSTQQVTTPDGVVTVNRYLLQNGDDRALVLYWYQGRGRVAASEYAVKWDLLRDAALRGRTEEALVRVMVPVRDSEEASSELAARVAAKVVPAVFRALPEA